MLINNNCQRNHRKMNCQANEYDSDCSGAASSVDVVFLYRDTKGRCCPDQTVKVCMCEYHREWLEKIHENKPFEMRGEEPENAIHEDLFAPFANKSRIYTALMVHYRTNIAAPVQRKFVLMNGKRDFAAFKKFILETDTNLIDYTYELGMFQTHFVIDSSVDADKSGCIETVCMINPITDTDCIDALAAGSVETYYPIAESSSSEYRVEALPAAIHFFFAKQIDTEEMENFQECLTFIQSNIPRTIIDWESIRETSPHTSAELFVYSQKLKFSLVAHDELALQSLKDNNELTDDVLWVTYISANHELLWSRDEHIRYTLQHSIRLTKLFIARHLEHKLLTLAISGERQQYLSVHVRDSHDILHDNAFVVEMLVPAYVGINCGIIKYDNCEGEEATILTPLDYFDDFSNETFSICPDRWNEPIYFNKNEDIRLYLQKCKVQQTAFENKYMRDETEEEKAFRVKYEKAQEKRDKMIMWCLSEQDYKKKHDTYTHMERIHELERTILDEHEERCIAVLASDNARFNIHRFDKSL
jgi:hypothetical protein